MAENGESFQELLSKVFDLILFNVDKIVDDTSLEKLLEILEFAYNNPREQKCYKTCNFGVFKPSTTRRANLLCSYDELCVQAIRNRV